MQLLCPWFSWSVLKLPLTRCADDEGNESSRSLGLIVARGTLLVLISPVDGSEEIANPFQQTDELAA
jgi:hypothetical protein